MTDLLHAELVRLRTTRLLAWTALSAVVGALLTTAATITSAGTAGLPDLDTSAGIRNVVNGAASGTVMALIIGVLLMAGEFRHGTATATFLVTPDRRQVVAAKLVAGAGVGLLCAVLATVSTLAMAVPWLAAEDVDFSLLSRDVGVVVAGALAATLLYGAVGVSMGSLIRNQTFAVVATLVWTMVVEGLLVGLLPDVGRWLPGGAAAALTDTSSSGGDLLPIWAGGLLFTAYALVLAAAGVRATVRGDVS